MLSGAVKAEVAMEEKMLPSGTPEAGSYKWPSKVSATDDSKVSTLASIVLQKVLQRPPLKHWGRCMFTKN